MKGFIAWRLRCQNCEGQSAFGGGELVWPASDDSRPFSWCFFSMPSHRFQCYKNLDQFACAHYIEKIRDDEDTKSLAKYINLLLKLNLFYIFIFIS